MKIAFLNIYNGVINRGAETFIKEIASRLAINHQISVYQSGEAMGNEKYKVITVPVSWNWKKKSGVGTLAGRLFIDYCNRQIACFTLRVLPKIIKEKFDIVVAVNGGWQPALLRLATLIYGGKLVITGQSGIGWDDRNNLWCFPNVFVALSKFAEKWARRANPFVKLTCIPNGVDTKKFITVGEKYPINLRKPIVLCVAALTTSKRVHLTIEAVAKIKDTSLMIVGDGDLKEKVLKLGKEKLGNRFQLIKLPFEEMPKVYRSCDTFTIPSEAYYSFEIVLLEAMATNLPVVANDDPIRREIVGEAGILVDPTDPQKYAEALKKALSLELGEKPRSQAAKFDWDKIAEKYERLFKSL